jgi:putative DNA primase/helicase
MTVAKRDLINLGLKPAQRFVYEWVRGYLPLPLVGCSAEQLYQAFLHWCRQNGERFAPNKASFGSSARKAVDVLGERTGEGPPVLDNKTVRLPFSRNEQTLVRMWIPAKNGPRDDQKIGEWAVDAMDVFESALRKFKGAENEESY